MIQGEVIITQLSLAQPYLSQILAIERSSFNHYDAYNPADFKRWVAYNPHLCWMAISGQRVAGYVISRALPDTLDLASLAVHPDYRRCGVGAALLDRTILQMGKYGVNRIELEVRRSNRAAIDFWQKLGFVPFGELPGFYGDGEGALRMRKTIPPI